MALPLRKPNPYIILTPVMARDGMRRGLNQQQLAQERFKKEHGLFFEEIEFTRTDLFEYYAGAEGNPCFKIVYRGEKPCQSLQNKEKKLNS